MDVHEALYTTRAMRRVRPDPIPEEVQARILDAAVRAPTGGNAQNWRFVFVDDPEVKAQLGPLYRSGLQRLFGEIYADRVAEAEAEPDTPETAQFERMRRSAVHLGEHFEGYPLLLFAFGRGDPTGGSIFPAVWSAMLAARAEGVGSTLTSLLLFEGDRVTEILGVPTDEGWLMACCVPMGYPTGTWGVARRLPANEVAFRNRWGIDFGVEIPEPLWPAP